MVGFCLGWSWSCLLFN